MLEGLEDFPMETRIPYPTPMIIEITKSARITFNVTENTWLNFGPGGWGG